MINRLYEKIKVIMKNNFISFLSFGFVLLCLTVPLPYYVFTGGGTINITDRIEIKDAYKSKGSFNLAYVEQLQATVPTYLLSYVIPDWKVESISSYVVSDKENTDDVSKRDHLYLDSANSSAISVAYKLAGADFNVTNVYNNVMYISNQADTNLKIGDIIIELEGKTIKDINEYKNYVDKSSVGTKMNLTVLRDGKKKKAYIYIKNISGEKLTGISVLTTYDYDTDPKIKILFKDRESGSSGGFTTALAIYNMLVKEDITHGKKIVGTGTILDDGTVEEIGGVTYKLKGAVKSKADIFFVPKGENYEEAKAFAKKKKYSIKIVPVENIEDAIKYLEKLK